VGSNTSLSLSHQARSASQGGTDVIALGVVLLVIGFVFGVSILWTLGVAVIVIGVILFVLGSAGHAVGGRRHYW
jgi:hypothetical protein